MILKFKDFVEENDNGNLSNCANHENSIFSAEFVSQDDIIYLNLKCTECENTIFQYNLNVLADNLEDMGNNFREINDNIKSIKSVQDNLTSQLNKVSNSKELPSTPTHNKGSNIEEMEKVKKEIEQSTSMAKIEIEKLNKLKNEIEQMLIDSKSIIDTSQEETEE